MNRRKMEFKEALGGLLIWLLVLHGNLSAAVQGREVLQVSSSVKKTNHYVFNIAEAPYTRLCETKSILTVNGKYPGPTLRAHKGETLTVDVYNNGRHNMTIHWHGVKQVRNPWSDGPEYVTQCPIQPGHRFTQTIVLTLEEGTIWWHAHSSWMRATVHGAIVVYPKSGHTYPFPKPHREQILILGEWWKSDVYEVYQEMMRTGGTPNVSDAYTINGQPGDLYPCSKNGTFELAVEKGKSYLLRLVHAGMNEDLFFSIAGHRVTVVGSDASYTKPLETDYVMITPGETLDLLLVADQRPDRLYYMAARAYSSNQNVSFDNTTATAVLRYGGLGSISRNSSTAPRIFPQRLPLYNDTPAAFSFARGLRSLDTTEHPVNLPTNITDSMYITLSVNELPCPPGFSNSSCQGPNTTRFAASTNNVSFVMPSLDVLQAYYRRIRGVYNATYPNQPPLLFDFTANDLPLSLLVPELSTRVKVLEYGAGVEMVLQGTSLVSALNHPMHLHGYSFFVVGMGFGNFDKDKDPDGYNLVDPPKKNTIGVPRNGWVAIRFSAVNPGVWFWHCHLERHMTWGMRTVFIVKDGKQPDEKMLPPPKDMPPC